MTSSTSDLRVASWQFSDTTTSVEGITSAGLDFLGQVFGAGCTSIEIPLSKADDFARFAEQKGYSVSIG